MKNVVKGLLYVDSHDSLMRVLQSWRLWVIGAIVGALLATGIYSLFPPPYRARAVVVVDQNIEQAWNLKPDQAFYFLGRETRKLEELAWSDETLQLLADQVGDTRISDLRHGKLYLSQPSDGGWDFYADDKDAARAELLASTWAKVFYQQVYDHIEISAELERARAEISEVVKSSGDNLTSNDLQKIIDDVSPLLNQTKGISPYVELSLAQVTELTVTRRTSMAVFIISGSVIGACGLALAALMILKAEERNEFMAE